MTREDALAIGRRVQMHPYEGKSLAERIADELLKAYELGMNHTPPSTWPGDGARAALINESRARRGSPARGNKSAESRGHAKGVKEVLDSLLPMADDEDVTTMKCPWFVEQSNGLRDSSDA